MSESGPDEGLESLRNELRDYREREQARLDEIAMIQRQASEQSTAIVRMAKQIELLVNLRMGEQGVGAQAQAAPGGDSARGSDPADTRAPREDVHAGGGGGGTSRDRAGGGGMVPAEVGPRVSGQPGDGGRERGFSFGGESTNPHSDDGRAEYVQRTAPFMKMPVPVLKSRIDWPAFRDKVFTFAKYFGFEDVLLTEQDIDVGSNTIDRETFIREHDVPGSTYDRHLKAWIFFGQAFQTTTDLGRMKRILSPSRLWRETVEWYTAITVGQQNELRSKLANFKMSRGSNPTEAMLAIEDIAADMRNSGLTVDEQHVLSVFVSALPEEYDLEVREIHRKESFNRAEIMALLRSAYDVMQRRKKGSSHGHALVSDGARGGGSTRGRGRDRSGARGGGRSSRSGGRGGKGDRGTSTTNEKKPGDGGKSGGESAKSEKAAPKGPLCYKCRRRGHMSAECTVEICERCKGAGHSASVCPSPDVDEVLMTIRLPEKLDVPDPGDGFLVAETMMAMEGKIVDGSFVADEVDAGGAELSASSAEASVAQGESIGHAVPIGCVGGVALQAGGASESWIFDSGSSGHVTPNPDSLRNFRSCNRFLRVASGSLLPIEGHGDLTIDFRSGVGVERVELSNVAYVPRLSYNLLSLTAFTKQDTANSFFGNHLGTRLNLKSGKRVLAPFVGNLNLQYGVRVDSSESEVACATLAPGLLPTTNVDPNAYHRSTSHAHSRLLMHSAKQQGVTFKKDAVLQPCVGCSAAKGYRAPVKTSTECRSDERLGRVFVDLSGKKAVPSHGKNLYTMVFRDDKTRMTWEYYLRSKDEAPIGLEKWLAEIRDVGVPKIIRSDDASELRGGRFGEICRVLRIKREFTSADRPQLNGVAERGLTLIAKLAKASAIQAKVSCVGLGLPATEKLWPEAHSYACDALNRTATSSNPDYKSPYEMWYGKPPPPTLLEWLQPCFYRVTRGSKTDAQAKPAFYLGPAKDHPRDCVRIYSKETRQVLITRNVTWQHVPPATPSSALQKVPAPVGGEDSGVQPAGEGREGTSRPGGGGEDASDDEDDQDVTRVDGSRRAGVGGGGTDEPPKGKPASAVSPGGSFGGGEIDGPTTHDGSSGGDGDSRSAEDGSGSGGGDGSSRSAEDGSGSSGSDGGISSSSSSGGSDSGSESGASDGRSGSNSADDSGSGGNDGGSASAGDGDGGNDGLPKGEARRLAWGLRDGVQLFPSRTRGGARATVEPDMGSALVSEAVEEALQTESERGCDDFGYDEMYEYLCCSSGRAVGESKDDVDDFNSNVFSLLSSVNDPVSNDVALAVDGPVKESDVCLPSGPVSEAEVPPVSVAGVHKSRYASAWQDAMDAEMNGLKASNTFTVLDKLPEGEKAVGSRWVYSYKQDKDGLIVKTKARLVAQGFMQREGVDFFQTSAPTPAAASVKVVLAFANELGYPVHHLDTAQAFTQAELDCTVYMKLPGGCGNLSGKIVRLEKALYGLRQSGLLWNELLVNKFVMRHGMEQCKTDPCVFRKIRAGKVVLVVVVHVDDMAVAGTEDEVRELHGVLNEDFTTNHLGELSLFTGCVVSQDVKNGYLTMRQTAFVETLARRFDVTTTSEFPAVPGANLEARMEGESGGPWAYREAVGSLMWLVTMTRPDIANAVRAVARHSHNPTERHWKAVSKIIQYLLGSKYLGLTFERGSGLEMSLYTDSNYAEKADDRRSVSGVAVMLCFAVVDWMSSTQRLTASSTTEAEYISMGDGVKEGLFVKGVVSFVQPELSEKCFPVFVDNAGSISLATNPLSSARTKHIDVRFHFIRELVRSRTISIVYVPTADQHADILTKPLTGNTFVKHRAVLMNIPV